MAMSQNSYSQSLMGFSVHQPAPGALLQFFPEMGSQQLDEMIDAYVPGTASIQDKRTTVSLEFCEHSMVTGEMYKFFLVYPAAGSSTASPASTMQDSGYASSFNTSPVQSQNMWNETTMDWPFAAASPKKARTSAKKAAPSSSRTQTGDFSHIPGMKIMTKEGVDVTNAASRGCKTKEQRDHAHLMRIIKACDSCKRKKTRCDPSHKKRGSSIAASPEPRVSSKKVKKAAPPPKKKQLSPAAQAEITFDSTLDPMMAESLSFDADLTAAAESTVNDWDQFITFNDEITDVPQDYDFFFDTTSYYSPMTTEGSASASSSQILTPGQSQPVTPAHASDMVGGTEIVATDLLGLGSSYQKPTLPYLQDANVEAGNNYVDFALYSPGSSCLDEDPAMSTELSASRSPEEYIGDQRSTSSIPGVQSTSRGGVNISSQQFSPRVVDRRNASTLGDVQSVLARDGLTQSSDQTYYDPGHDRDQGFRQSGQQVSDLSWNTRASPHPIESRVPGGTVSPSDTLLRLPPRPGVHSTRLAGDMVHAASVLANGIEANSSRHPLATSAQTEQLLVTDRQRASTLRTADVSDSAVAAAGLTASSLSPRTSSGSGIGHQLTRPVHQRLRKGLASDRTDSAVSPSARTSTANDEDLVFGTQIIASSRRAQQDISGTIASSRRAQQDTSGIVANVANERVLGQDLSAVQSHIALSRGRELQSQVVAVASSKIRAAVASASSNISATKSGTAGTPAGLAAMQNSSGPSPVNGLQSTATMLPKVSKLADNATFSVQGVQETSAVALISSFFALSLAFSLSPLAVGYSPSLVSMILVVLSFAAVSSLQQYSISCGVHLGLFTRNLCLAGQLSGNAANNAKSKIQETQSWLAKSSGRNNAPSRAHATRHLINSNLGVARLVLV
ncbi:hypothetical protein PFICI_02815 [Pestalotiopsis fici W106-1]|uniref:Uncharacterized protein n=1 Tax=Pestalotiopsis fici (strain W106-1 / CGMCC3.15140) TaxID=1229662 RepID=W3XFI7_PESFW|nr:uncharacterized protein PFICI_02815 [Pestalotiopsis fici W106-1]ETS84790.1 hypothetical protein PFICI_02815 [Pestalotiopsis fici W106-1]